MVNTLFLPELREMLAENNSFELHEFCTALHPARTAEFMEGLEAADSWSVLRHADLKLREEIFAYFPHEKQIAIIQTQDRSEIAELLADIAADDRVDLLHDVQPTIVEELLPLLPADERREILKLREYPENTAGAMMTTEVAMIGDALTVRKAIDELSREAEHLETIYYIYVVDRDQRLRGVVTARRLLTALGKPDKLVRDLMDIDLIVVHTSDPSQEVTAKVAKYDLHAIPVVDDHERLVGIITHDDVIDAFRQEATEDAQRSAAVAPLEAGYMQTSLLTLWWKRGVWLTVLFVTAMFTASALRYYEGQLIRWGWLIIFIPLIMSSGGNSGNQSATLIITALTTGNIKLSDWRRILWRELLVGLMLGGMLAVAGFCVAWFQTMGPEHKSHSYVWWPLVVPLTLVLVVTCGAVSGSVLPLLFKRLGLDPALMSNPFVAGVSDILAIVIYMTVAVLLLR
ncbi:MAG: magnesium transporter [Planctomycetaceae bacterium]|nr:magnesium transporter [Planctomycetaceae bacterium]